MTYSIVARDPDSGNLGVAVQTCNLAVGAWVPWARAGVGAVATQSVAERSYGTLGLDLMDGGKTAVEALTALLAVDPRREFRQVAMIDASGNLAVHTGSRCFPEAGSFTGPTFSAQANMMARNTVWQAMAAAYEAAEGDFAERLLAALDAAQAEGGDVRGMQTAALLVVGHGRAKVPLTNLRVDHHSQPLKELHRLLRLHRAYMAEHAIFGYLESGQTAAAYEAVQKIGEWAPDEPYLQYLRAMHLAGRLDRRQEALEILHTLIQSAPIWKEYLQREATVDHFDCPGLGKQLLAALDS